MIIFDIRKFYFNYEVRSSAFRTAHFVTSFSSPSSKDKYVKNSTSSIVFPTKSSRLRFALHRIRKMLKRIPFEKRRMKLLTFITLVIVSTVFIKGILMISSFVTSWIDDAPTLTFEKQNYSPVKYLGIGPNISTRLPKGVTIYHITKEFGAATLGGLGELVTGLSQAQSKNSSLNVNVIMPYYSYLSKLYRPHKYAHLSIKIRDKSGKWKNVGFLVYRTLWNTSKNNILTSNSEIPSGILSVFMIGPASNMIPLNTAFKASSIAKIKNSNSKLLPEWKDLYFCKAAAELIAYRNTIIDTSLFAIHETRGVDVVHVHGSTNAFMIEFLDHINHGKKFGKKIPAVVYTIHDYLEEQIYSNDLTNIQKFLDVDVFQVGKPQYFHNDRMYMSGYAIDNAQMVTFVSKDLAREMVE
ncbi:12132_t:CDS:2 [Funneliformis caledonium]|uniref:12132_t:CDS:1 n=1 Tax=Funneliformis caledonium TaxID=1117310 RepID=A0A9N9GL40_9GLOM|nr:12132_t:CDS:2 [Funneliformis caledonium]